MKKYIPLVIAAVVFLLALVLLQPEATSQVVVLVSDLPAGHTMTAIDMAVRDIPDSFLPLDAITSPAQAIGQTLKTDHAAGDILRKAHLGEPIALKPDERAIAIQVDDASGMGGLIAPGDTVGLTAVIFGNQAGFFESNRRRIPRAVCLTGIPRGIFPDAISEPFGQHVRPATATRYPGYRLAGGTHRTHRREI